MSTIASPRPSISLSSRRTSTSTDTTTRSTSTSRPPPSGASSLRRNRTALRDYYKLKDAASVDARDAPEAEGTITSELDRPDFDAQEYVQSLLAREGLEGVLKIEAGLISGIRGLDGEKKALVYDNYSKLIAATDTIRRMREKMDPVTETSNLMGDIGQIAERANMLSDGLSKGSAGQRGGGGNLEQQRQTVRWVLDAPRRLGQMVDDSKHAEAEAEKDEIFTLLDGWKGVNGVEGVRRGCEAALEHQQSG
ncbi:hypothetical protein LTR78_002691 [Recurvomyces mirabilis]|uniref:Vacuolar protein sorting-associated protein 51 homolog n=1 Tax=Recurvomyces mirabilis TaxID=574656 RepID=A0AAE1C450_9PEZI|nr:hypothetical protein LTR78_002691 [Recurvomyces mirabilis]KAK5159574.1 hypothetical protein LTS14_002716 [Recurvomyces mirabilis]